MLAKDLIDRLERLGLLDQEIIEALREQLAQSGARVTPEAVAKLLVDNGQLTRFQATKLIGELRSSDYSDPDENVAGGDQPIDDFALLDGDEAIAEPVDVLDEAVVIDAEPVAESYSAESAVAKDAEPAATRPSPRDPSSGDPSSGDPSSGDPSSRPKKVNAGKKVRDPSKSIWDSFKIYGVAATIMILLFIGTVLYFVLNKGSADKNIEVANGFYSKQSYDVAKNAYEMFLKNFGQSNPHSSIARTRLAMSELYLFSQFTDPARATKEAEVILPKIENEPGMEEERNNLAALLVEVADNIAQAAGKAKETPEKQRLLADLDRQILLIENPAYVTSAARTALAGQLLGVNETRARVQRDINRNLRLDESVSSMESSLKDKKTKDAYDTRFALLRDFPELRNDTRLVTLVSSASQIQQQLVKPATDLPLVTNEPLAIDAVKKIVLTSPSGESSPGLADEVVYIRVHGGILAFRAADGKLLWRRYVGYGQDHTPIPINPGGQDGVLLSDSQSLEVQRTDGQEGEIRWRTKIGEPFSQPVAHGRDIYLSTQGGRLIAIDSDSGEPRWATQIPQPLEESPGINDTPGKLYVTGDHSNLYVIDKRNGKCAESFYIGHAKGTCAVPPVTLQGTDGGHVFVFENAGVDFALMHILKCDKEGGVLRVAQPAERLVGNVTVSPIMVLGRRLIVLTDRGQVKVFDIEQTAKVSEQVRVSAEQVASYESPTSTQMAVGKNQMWVSGTRIGRFELQVSTGRVVRDWVFNEGDTFIGSPVLIGDTLVHARILRGTSGVRVTGADPVTGRPFWQTDVGVPVSMLTPLQDRKGFHAITSQAALFDLTAEDLAAGATSGPSENPGGSGVAMRFENPLRIDEQRTLMLNEETGGQICVYDPTRAKEKLRILALAIPSGKPSGNAVFAGEGLMLPLDSGRIMLMDWKTGKSLASPFQPASDPGKTVRWTDSVVMESDSSQVVIADDRKKLYRIRVAEQIRELASTDLKEPLLGRLAGIGNTVIGSSSGPSADFLIGFSTDSLEETTRFLLDGRITWGPYAAGDRVLLQTDDRMLRAYDATGKSMAPPVELPQGLIIPGVKNLGDKLLLTGRSGWLVVVDAMSGALVGKSDLGQPLSAQPLEAGKMLLVPGAEGLVYITSVPSSVDAP
jgi:outer membrane protein assembly factor BamB